jgi:hypothetical protein
MLSFAKNSDNVELHPILSPSKELLIERAMATQVLTKLIFKIMNTLDIENKTISNKDLNSKCRLVCNFLELGQLLRNKTSSKNLAAELIDIERTLVYRSGFMHILYSFIEL